LTTRSKPYHHGDLRRALIVAGIELLTEGGAATLDLRTVARKAGVSHAAPYRHFEDKRALVVAIAEEGFIRLSDKLKNAVENAALDTQLLALTHAYVDFALTEPALMREMFSGLTINRMDHPSLHEESKVALGIVIQMVEHAQASGSIIQGSSDKVALVIWSMVHGLAMLLLENQLPMVTVDPNGIDDIIRQSVATLYDGLRPR
jgi:AcrR family transcriptional regulator